MISSWSLPHFYWGIWKERNNNIFKDREAPTFVIANKIVTTMKENFTVRKEGDIEEGGNTIVKKKDRERKREEAKWLLPPKGWHKANFDGVAKGNLGPAGYGRIIRNGHGKGVVAFSYPLGIQMNHFAEATATYHVVKLPLATRIENLWLEGESLNTVNCLKGCTKPS